MKLIFKILIIFITIILQIVIGHLFAFFISYAGGVGASEPWVFIVWPFLNTVGIWTIGSVVNKKIDNIKKRRYATTLIGTFISAFVGMMIMVNVNFGFGLSILLFNPLTLGIIGYWVVYYNI